MRFSGLESVQPQQNAARGWSAYEAPTWIFALLTPRTVSQGEFVCPRPARTIILEIEKMSKSSPSVKSGPNSHAAEATVLTPLLPAPGSDEDVRPPQGVRPLADPCLAQGLRWAGSSIVCGDDSLMRRFGSGSAFCLEEGPGARFETVRRGGAPL